jgi:hypothetical protein
MIVTFQKESFLIIFYFLKYLDRDANVSADFSLLHRTNGIEGPELGTQI